MKLTLIFIATKFFINKYGFFLVIKKAYFFIKQTKKNTAVFEKKNKKNTSIFDLLIEKLIESYTLAIHSPLRDNLIKKTADVYRRFGSPKIMSGIVENKNGPKISLIMPVFNPPLEFLEQAIKSVKNQIYLNWELCIVDDGSDIYAVNYLKRISKADKRIKFKRLLKNYGISKSSNEAIKISTGKFLAFLDQDDLLTNDALLVVARTISENLKTDILYSDECKIDSNNYPTEFFTKPDWDYLYLMNSMYLGHLKVYRRSLVIKVGGLRSAFNFSQDYDLALRLSEITNKIIHIPEVLYGWRMHNDSASMGGKPYARETNIKSLQAACDRRKYNRKALPLPHANKIISHSGRFKDLVSIIIPSDNEVQIKLSVASIAEKTSYKKYEIIVVTNSRLIKKLKTQKISQKIIFVSYDKTFNFSDKCNEGVNASKGKYVIFYNDDIYIENNDWIESLLEFLSFKDVGIVGGKLLYEDRTIQHAGMATGVRNLVGTILHKYPANTSAHCNLGHSVRKVSVISGALLAIKKEVFVKVGGFNAVELPIYDSDLDLCFKVRDLGLSCVYTPYAQFTHTGHLSLKLFEKKSNIFPYKPNKSSLWILKNWQDYIGKDPYFTKATADLIYHDSPSPYELFLPKNSNKKYTGKDILIVSHDLSKSGAPRMVVELARCLDQAGHFVIVVSPTDGPTRDELNSFNIGVIVDSLILSNDLTTVNFYRNFDKVILNTVINWPVINHLHKYTSIYLYAHEGELIHEIARSDGNFIKHLSYLEGIWAASESSRIALGRYTDNIKLLLCGIHNNFQKKSNLKKRKRKIQISIFGSYELRKGQDILIDAIKILPKLYRGSCEFNFHGRPHDPLFYSKLKSAAKDLPNVFLKDDSNYLKNLLAADLIVIPSREEPLSLVGIDALAHYKPLILSKSVGVSRYLRDNVSCFLVNKLNKKSLAEKIVKAIKARNFHEKIAHQAHGIYEDKFSKDIFSKKLFNHLGL
jgi:GT2 family glycosyltransferase/glycosyltransferase involved in cell wall biosynthesis